MKKKGTQTLIMLLLVPFVAGLLTYVSISVLSNTIGIDISDISFSYKDNDGFKMTDDPYPLEATPVYDHSLSLSSGNNLVWKVENVDKAEDEHAKIVIDKGAYALKTDSVGEIKLTCSNEKGSKSKYFYAEVYDRGFIQINPSISNSGHSAHKERKYGQYDMSYSSLSSPLSAKKAKIQLDVSGIFDDSSSDVGIYKNSDNISYSNGVIEINGSGEASLVLELNDHPYIQKEFSFFIVENAYNVYSYDDLLKGTNYSLNGESLCLQKNFESLKNTYKNSNGLYVDEALKDDTVLFGHFDFDKQDCDFTNDYYSFTTTGNHSFLDTYNAANPDNQVSTSLKAGLHLQKSLYGNGFTINMHELCYPTHGELFSNGLISPIKNKDYFYGPLPLLSIGDPSSPLISCYAQDNAGVYIDDDGVSLDDISLHATNTDISNLYDLTYTGSLVDVEAKNVSLTNSNLSYARSLVRAYSSDNLLLKNDLLSTSREFLLHVGSNTIKSPDKSKNVSIPYGSKTINDTFGNFFDNLDDGDLDADGILNDYLQNGFSQNGLTGGINTFNAIQSSLDNTGSFYSGNNIVYENTINIENVYFYRSGLFSIALDTSFNGPYLYNGLPSYVSQRLGNAISLTSPNEVGGTSAPSKVVLKGDTRFYDWKDTSKVSADCLVDSQLGTLFGQNDLNVDSFFPMRKLLTNVASNKDYLYQNQGISYLNSAIAYYGGGKNLSALVDERENPLDVLSDKMNVSFLEASTNADLFDNSSLLMLLSRSVSLAIGFNPFHFITNAKVDGDAAPYFGETPKFADLIKNNEEQ
jgi:hypothetical protein